MHERLLIVGAGGFGREVLSWVLQIPESQRTCELSGFLDDRLDALDGLNLPAKVIGTPAGYSFKCEDRVVVAVGQPRQKRALVKLLTERGARFNSVIHPSVAIGLNTTWGVGCIFCPGVVLTTNVKVGNHVVFNCNSSSGHDSVIGDYCTMSGHVDVMGCATLGEGVFLGSHACVLPQARVGDGAIIGAGSVVLKKVAPQTTVMGIPAREVWKQTSHKQ
jgi:sugar O-acyltransferase (sialic acid O-acetyltransferase NeuD family)